MLSLPGLMGKVLALSLCSIAVAVAPAAASSSGTVTVLHPDGQTTSRHDPYIPAISFPDVPQQKHAGTGTDTGSATTRPTLSRPTAQASANRPAAVSKKVVNSLKTAFEMGQIEPAEYRQWLSEYRSAKAAYKRLKGIRRKELGAAIGSLEAVAKRNLLTPTRSTALFLTLRRNLQWWTKGPLLAGSQRVGFPGSRLVFQYYPGQGIQLQMLANFGKANAYWASKKHDRELRELLDELVGLAADRAGGIAWEYYFRFGGGAPPWTSALSQGTAIQALSRAAIRLNDPSYFLAARKALTVFQLPPPVGIRVETQFGAHYLIYSFNPKLRVLNGFIQSLIGLYDFSTLANDQVAKTLFDQGNTQAQAEVPKFDTGSWSLYSSLGKKSDLGYHKLLRDFLRNLCERTAAPVYCSTADRFTGYLKQPTG